MDLGVSGVSKPGGTVHSGIFLLISIPQAADVEPLSYPHCYGLYPPCSFLLPAFSRHNLSLGGRIWRWPFSGTVVLGIWPYSEVLNNEGGKKVDFSLSH